MKEELDIIERLEMNPKVLEKLKTIEDIRLYLENGIFNMTKFLDDNNIKNIKMKIKHLREWLDTLPQELDEHDLVFRKIIPGDDESWLAHDKPITACGIDEGSNEAYFCDEASHEVMKNS